MAFVTFVVIVATLAALRGLFGFAPPGLPGLGEGVGAALACVAVKDMIGVVWGW